MRGVVKWGRNREPLRRLLMKSAILWRISRLFSSAVTTSFRAAETGDTGAGGGGRLSARAKTPGRLTPAGREAGHADASPVTLPVCDVSGMFFSDVIFLWLPWLLLFFFLFFFPFLSCLWLFRASPWRAGCRERSQRSCLSPGGLPSLTPNPRLAATVPVAPPLSRRGLRSWHPGKRPPGCEGQRRFAHALFVVAAGPCSLPAGCHTPI